MLATRKITESRKLQTPKFMTACDNCGDPNHMTKRCSKTMDHLKVAQSMRNFTTKRQAGLIAQPRLIRDFNQVEEDRDTEKAEEEGNSN